MLSYSTVDEIGGLVHVGTMDISRKSNQSLEWNGLSVSNCPDAWKQICGCAGARWHLVPKDGAGKLLLYHDLDEADHGKIRKWAIGSGWFDEDVEYRVWWHDDEYGEDRCFAFSGDEKKRALDELHAKEDEEYDGVHLEEVRDGMKPTARLERESLVAIGPGMYKDIAAMLYAEHELECDGVWWEDRYDPYSLSAPRGVLFNSRLDRYDAVEKV